MLSIDALSFIKTRDNNVAFVTYGQHVHKYYLEQYKHVFVQSCQACKTFELDWALNSRRKFID